MRHLKAYESVDDLLGDLEDLGVNKKMLGWWVKATLDNHTSYFIIYEEEIGRGMIRLMEKVYVIDEDPDPALIEEIRRCDGYSELDSIVSSWDDRGSSFYAWEMTPRVHQSKGSCNEIDQPNDLPKVVELGRKYFSDFDQKLKASKDGDAS